MLSKNAIIVYNKLVKKMTYFGGVSMEQMISWFEIPCIDIQRAANFYSEIFEKTLEITDFQGIDTAFFPTGGALVLQTI